MTKKPAFVHNDVFIAALKSAVDGAIKKHDSGRLLKVRISNLAMVLANYGNDLAMQTMEDLVAEIQKLISNDGKAFLLGYDTLAVLFEKTNHPIAPWVEKIHLLIQHFGCKIASTPVYLLASMGSVNFPETADSLEKVIEYSTVALDIADQDPVHYYLPYEDTGKKQLHVKHQMILANYMQNAILNKRLRLAFQPIIHSQTGHVMYHESLLRVVDDNGKITSAGPFIPVAETLGFIDVIDDIVMEMVWEELRNSPHIMLAFNISNLTVHNEKWLAKTKKLFSDPDIASRAVVEMTETAMHGDLKTVSRFIASLQELGCQIAVDDFGAGYTSFRQLKSLPVDIVKIDGYFVKDIVDNSDNRLFVKTLLEFTRGLGLKAVAEFVETGEIAKLLMELKVDYMQGNYFCPAVNYRSWIKEDRYA